MKKENCQEIFQKFLTNFATAGKEFPQYAFAGDTAMLGAEPALEACRIGLADGRVGGKSARCAVYKSTCRHNDLTVVAGHIPRFGTNKGIDRRALLHAANKIGELLFRFKPNGARDIRGRFADFGEIFIPERFKALPDKQAPFQRLRDHMGRGKKPLIKEPIPVGIRTDFTADGRRRQTVFATGIILIFPREISPVRPNPASRVLNERTRDQIGADGARLRLFYEFAVAVIHKNTALETALPNKRAHFFDLFDRKRVAEIVPAAPTAEEKAHDFLWRFRTRLPAPGQSCCRE